IPVMPRALTPEQLNAGAPTPVWTSAAENSSHRYRKHSYKGSHPNHYDDGHQQQQQQQQQRRRRHATSNSFASVSWMAPRPNLRSHDSKTTTAATLGGSTASSANNAWKRTSYGSCTVGRSCSTGGWRPSRDSM